METQMCCADTRGPLASCGCSAVRNLGVVFHGSTKLDKQISAVVESSCFFFFIHSDYLTKTEDMQK